jgi:hypothetical protein
VSKKAKAWARLPNSAHIDRVISHVKAHPGKWDAAWHAVSGEAAEAAWEAAWGPSCFPAWYSAWHAARDAALSAARDAARGAARGACLALIAWDDCAYILDLPPDAVKTLVNAGDDAAVLLYPAVIAMQGEAGE